MAGDTSTILNTFPPCLSGEQKELPAGGPFAREGLQNDQRPERKELRVGEVVG